VVETPGLALWLCILTHDPATAVEGCHKEAFSWEHPGAANYVTLGNGDYISGMYDLDRTKTYMVKEYYASTAWPDAFCPTHPGGSTGPGVWGDNGGPVYGWEYATYVADVFRNNTITGSGGGGHEDYYKYNTYPHNAAAKSIPCDLLVEQSP
jgi:hypothetical protein